MNTVTSSFLEALQKEMDLIRDEMKLDIELNLLYGSTSPLDRAVYKAARKLAAESE